MSLYTLCQRCDDYVISLVSNSLKAILNRSFLKIAGTVGDFIGNFTCKVWETPDVQMS